MVTERISLEGHLVDENTLAHLFGLLDSHGVSFKVRRFKIGELSETSSLIDLELSADTQEQLSAVLQAASELGAEMSLEDIETAEADRDGVLPEEFYSTTNFATMVRIEGDWVPVEDLEMDVGIRIWKDEFDRNRASTCAMHRVKRGDRLVVGFKGVRIVPPENVDDDMDDFRFMANEISSERPKARMIAHCASMMRKTHEEGKRILFVGGPAVIHSGSAWMLELLIERGWIDVLFAGNALAAHDIEAAMLGTSLGVDLKGGHPVPHGHTHHLRAINRVRRSGSIRQAVDDGLISKGVMFTCVARDIPYVLAGSIRDDGPLPDVVTDNVLAQDTMRENIRNVGLALMVATTLHSVATGNILPAAVRTFCVDSDADTVIKLTDRGTHQAVGIVTDCEYFLKELCSQLGLV